jgi:sodium--glutamate symport carrier gltS
MPQCWPPVTVVSVSAPTPTAIANMQAITDRFGPSPVAFLVVPMVGAFLLISSTRW